MSESALRPLLKRYPDAHRSAAPLLEPILLPYVSLIFGSAVAAVAAAYNGVIIKRTGLVLRSLLLGALGWVAFILVVVLARQAGIENPRVLLILGRTMHFGFGAVLYLIHRPYFRGHEFLGGRAVALLPSYLTAFVISMMLPPRLELLLLGVPLV